MPDLTGKTALVTGGSRSLGKSIALKLADRGADVVITYRTKENEANEVVRAIEAKGRRAAAIQVDLDGTADLPRFLERLKDDLTERTGRSE